uniref:Peptidase_M14 domain-containing protein n=1 Tax=Steinernema glaseri TaxID=37863 RepID=A0A1I7ZZN2_9BILA
MPPVYSILLLLAVLVALLGTSFAELGPEGIQGHDIRSTPDYSDIVELTKWAYRCGVLPHLELFSERRYSIDLKVHPMVRVRAYIPWR